MKTIYAFFEKEIEEDEWDYTDEFKAELDHRYEYHINGGKMVSAEDAEIKTKGLVMKIKAGWRNKYFQVPPLFCLIRLTFSFQNNYPHSKQSR